MTTRAEIMSCRQRLSVIILAFIIFCSPLWAADITVQDSGLESIATSSNWADVPADSHWKAVKSSSQSWAPWITRGYYSDEPHATGTNNAVYCCEGYFYQVLDATFEQGVEYEFSVDVSQHGTGQSWRIYLFDAQAGSYDQPLVEATGSCSGQWQKASVSYLADSSIAGRKIGIAVTGSYYALFDNFAISSLEALPGVAIDGSSITVSAYGTEWRTFQDAVNGSGLSSLKHDTDNHHMAWWDVSATPVKAAAGTSSGCSWVRFDFDAVYELRKMWLWNWNTTYYQDSGLRDVIIEYSTDGTSWIKLGDFTVNQATFAAGYEHNTEIDCSSIRARHLVMTLKTTNGTWGGAYPGLSEVMFFTPASRATGPVPSSGSEDVPVTLNTLSWNAPADIADAKYDVWTGTDAGNLTKVGSNLSTTSCQVSLDAGVQYYWRVDTIDDSGSEPITCSGTLWSFSTEPPSLAAGPYVQFVSKGRVVIHWQTSDPVPTKLYYGSNQNSLAEVVADSPATDHHMTVSSLAPATDYYYRIGIGNDQTEVFSFHSEFDNGPTPAAQADNPYPADSLSTAYAVAAEHILRKTGITRGICIDYGCGNGRLAFELAKRSSLQIIGIEEDAAVAAQARNLLDQAGLYGRQVTIINRPLSDVSCRNYTANLIVSSKAIAQAECPGNITELLRVLRPDGGRAVIGNPSASASLTREQLEQWADGASAAYSIDEGDSGIWLDMTRSPLARSGSWDHYYGNIANTASSSQQIDGTVKLLWYGQPGPRYIIDRHNRPMASLYKKGIIITPGVNRLMAFDAFNGCRYWDVSLPHSARVAILRDTGWLALSDDYAWAAHKGQAVALNLKNGNPEKILHAPQLLAGEKMHWGYLAVDGANLYGSGQKSTASLINHSREHVNYAYFDNVPVVTSQYMFCKDAAGGNTKWTYRHSGGSVIVNSSIVVGGNAIYFVESRNPSAVSDADGRIRLSTITSGQTEWIVKLDKNTGQKLDERQVDLPFEHVCYLVWCADKNLLMACGTHSSGGTRYQHLAFNASDLSTAWTSSYLYSTSTGYSHGEQDQHPCIIGNYAYLKFHRVDMSNGSVTAFKLQTGGCGTVSGCETHLFARNGNPCMYSLPNASSNATKLTDESRPGCWINIIPAGGLVMIPESSAGCTCDYKLQSSMTFYEE